MLFCLLPRGFSNREMRDYLAPLLGREPSHMTPGRITYDLRRLLLHGFIERLPTATATASPTLGCVRRCS